MEKLFHKTQGKRSSRSARQQGMARRSVKTTLAENNLRWGSYQCLLGWKVGKQRAPMGYAHLSTCSIVLPMKSENINDNCEQECKGKMVRKNLRPSV